MGTFISAIGGNEMKNVHPYNRQVQPFMMSMNQMVERIDDPAQVAACKQFLREEENRILNSPGSSGAHHTWQGGYFDHIVDVMNIGAGLYETLMRLGPLDFPVGDVFLVLFWHDAEKPFRYWEPVDPLATSKDKGDRARFRQQLFDRFGLVLTERQKNGLRFVEGEIGGTHIPGERAAGRLAGICHAADFMSARTRYSRELMGATIF